MRAFSHVCSKEEAASLSAVSSTFCWAGNVARGTKYSHVDRKVSAFGGLCTTRAFSCWAVATLS